MTRTEDRLDAFDQRPRRTLFGWGISLVLIIAGLSLVGGIVFGAVNLLQQPGRIISKSDAYREIGNALKNVLRQRGVEHG